MTLNEAIKQLERLPLKKGNCLYTADKYAVRILLEHTKKSIPKPTVSIGEPYTDMQSEGMTFAMLTINGKEFEVELDGWNQIADALGLEVTT
jgi:hypothetical protein